jgi:flagellar secretion chaperone FliS
MSVMSALERYKAVQVKTSTPGDLLVMLYDGLFRFLDEALEAIGRDDRARTGDRISRAHAILGELAATLNKSLAPELCENLESVYFFCMNRLVEANLYRDAERVLEVKRVLEPLKDGFKAAVAEAARSQAVS